MFGVAFLHVADNSASVLKHYLVKVLLGFIVGRSYVSTFKDNNRWITENYDKLTGKFKDEWVAVLNRAVLDHDKDLRKLVDRLKAKHLKAYKQIAVDYISSGEIETVLPDNLWE